MRLVAFLIACVILLLGFGLGYGCAMLCTAHDRHFAAQVRARSQQIPSLVVSAR